jgi:hypothetical protein
MDEHDDDLTAEVHEGDDLETDRFPDADDDLDDERDDDDGDDEDKSEL